MSNDTKPKPLEAPPRAHRVILPFGPRILVMILKDEERSDAGLYLPAGAKDKHADALYGEVVEVARASLSVEEPGENVSGVPHGSKILFRKEAGVRVPWDDRLRILEVKEVLATVEELDEDEIN